MALNTPSILNVPAQTKMTQKDQNSANLRQKSTSDLNKNLRKGTKKSLNHAFKAVSEDDTAVSEYLKEFSEASDENIFAESAENYFDSVNPVEMHSSETATIWDLTSQSPSSSCVTTSYKHVETDETNTKSAEVDSSNRIGSIEADVVIKHLRQARSQVLKSKDLGPSKKVLEGLINIIIEEFHGGLYEESEWLDKLLSKQSNLVFLSFGMVILAIFVFVLLNLNSKGSYIRPTPT